MNAPIVFVVPGQLKQLTGGYLFDRRIVEGLRDRHHSVHVIELPGQFPLVDTTATAAAQEVICSLERESVLVIDGLALPSFASRLPLQPCHTTIGFIHHPLSLETGLTIDQASQMARLESTLWAALDGLICASPSTARSVLASGVPGDRIQVASPGVDISTSPIAIRDKSGGTDTCRLLCVATVTARKGHVVLVEALAKIRDYRWTLDCYGSLSRDPDTVNALLLAIKGHELEDRIRLHGEQPAERLALAWAEADLFVLPSFHEGYGMVLTEAIANGLPIISTRAGAIPETVPAQACMLVNPGDAHALAQVLHELMVNRARMSCMRQAVLEARQSLISWPEAIDHWLQALDFLLNRHRFVA